MHKLFSIFLLFFSATIFACNPGQGTGQCGYFDSTGYHNAPIGSNNYTNSSNNNYTNKTITIRLQDKYGAIALGTNGHYGFISNMPSKRKAQREALSLCKQHGGVNCEIVHSVRNGCLSIAEGFSNKAKKLVQIRTGSSPNRNESESVALNLCIKSGLSECKIIDIEQCSLPVLP